MNEPTGDILITDWDKVFSHQINRDSFNGYLIRNTESVIELFEMIKPILETVSKIKAEVSDV